jgi:HAD superfamily hydrolase (TIGR01549 family)
MLTLEGHLVHGLGQATKLTQIDWVRHQLIDLVGIDPYPGTVNLVLEDHEIQRRWQTWQALPGHAIEPAAAEFCRARCFPVRISGDIPAAVLLPERKGYPENRVELVAALPIRQYLALGEHARLRVDLCRPLPVKAILFDIDGTLVDSVGAYFEVARVAATAYRYVVTEEHVRHALATGSSFWKAVVPPDAHDRDSVTKALSMHAARDWPRVLKEHAKVFEGLAQTLIRLKSLGIRLGIVSGARREVLDLLAEANLLDLFEIIVLGSDVSKSKPDPEGILKCLELLKVAPGEAVYVGDAPVDIQASRAAGVRVVGVLSGVGTSAMLSMHGPDRIVSSHVKLPDLVVPS